MHTFKKCKWTKRNTETFINSAWIRYCISHSVASDSLPPHGLDPAKLLCPWDFPGISTELCCHSLLQGIFLTRDQTWISHTAGRFFTIWATREAQDYHMTQKFHTWVYIWKDNNNNSNLCRYMHLNVHSSIIYNCQDMKAI